MSVGVRCHALEAHKVFHCGGLWALRRLVNEDGFSIGRELLNIFRERGSPVEVLFDNGLVFKSDAVRRVGEKFWVKVMF